MSKQQWGHGFYAGIEAAQKETRQIANFPIGSYFLGEIGERGAFQGKVKAQIGDRYVVQFFSWVDGSLGQSLYTVPADQMQDWQWYETDAALRAAGDKYLEHTLAQIMGRP